MKLIKIQPQGIFQVNCYLVVSDENNGVLIDAPAGAEKIMAAASENGVSIKKILITHGHCDHIESLAQIANTCNAEVYIHTNDAPMLTDADRNLSTQLGPYLVNRNVPEYDKAVCINDGDVITLDELSFKVLHTPGHSGGCVCYILDDIIFSGDTLFNMSIGRTDFLGSDQSAMNDTLDMLYGFKSGYDDYRILAGHGDETTLSYEKENNPYF